MAQAIPAPQEAMHEGPPSPSPSIEPLLLEGVPQYLLRSGLMRQEQVFHQPCEIESRSRRNRNFKVKAGATRYLLKQAGGPDALPTVRLEGLVLRAFAEDPALQPLKPYVPRFVHEDPEAGILVTELHDPATSLTKLNIGAGPKGFPEDAAAEAGRILARVHSLDPQQLGAGPLAALPPRKPFAWDLPAGCAELRGGRSPAEVQYVQRLGASAAWRAPTALQEAWESERRLVHGDARWENFLVVAGPRPLLLIDWEHASLGDPAWDVASFFAEYARIVMVLALSFQLSGPEELKERTGISLASSRGPAKAFWEAYAEERRLGPAERGALLGRAMQAFPRVVGQAVLESLARQPAIPAPSQAFFDLAERSVHGDPALAKELLGLEAVA